MSLFIETSLSKSLELLLHMHNYKNCSFSCCQSKTNTVESVLKVIPFEPKNSVQHWKQKPSRTKCRETRPRNQLLGNLQTSWERREQSQCSAQLRASQPSRQVVSEGAIPATRKSRVPAGTYQERDSRHERLVPPCIAHLGEPDLETVTGSMHSDTRSTHCCPDGYVSEVVPREALAEGRSSLKLIFTWAFTMPIWESSFN